MGIVARCCAVMTAGLALAAFLSLVPANTLLPGINLLFIV